MTIHGLKQKLFPVPKAAPIYPKGRRILGLTLETREPIFAPKGHSLLLASAGAGKTTHGPMVWLFSYLSSAPDKAILVMDSKDGEMCVQTADMIAKLGRKVAIIDPMGVLPASCPHRVSLNPFAGIISTHQREKRDTVFSSENANYALIPEPENDERNAYWRNEPRTLIEFATYLLMKRNPKLATPGGVWALLGDPDMLRRFAAIEAEEGDGMLRVLAKNVAEMFTHEHFSQHRGAALKALRIFAIGTRLHSTGSDATLTPADLIRDKYVIFFVGPQAFMNRLGALYALNILAFNEAVYQGAGGLIQILDEFTNAPLKPLVESLTTLRGYGAELHMVAQSKSEIERRFGKYEYETIEDNSVVKQYFGITSFAEAERISAAIGETQTITPGLSADDEALRLQFSYQIGKERNLSPAALMGMPATHQLIYVRGYGFMIALKLSQAGADPYCTLVAPNTLEGGILPPNPKISLVMPKGAQS